MEWVGWLEHRRDAEQQASDPLRHSRSPSPEERQTKSAPSSGDIAAHGSHWSRSAGLLPQMLLSNFSEHPPMMLSGEEHRLVAERKLTSAGHSPELSASGSEWRVRSLYEKSLCHAVRA